MPASYIVITPVRNEEQFLPDTINSMVAQKLRPQQWVIVDDGSTDQTAELALAAARRHPWILVVRRPDRGFRKAGGGVVETFYAGYDEVKNQAWQFVVKLDGDLYFDPDYFERCLSRFARDTKLGIGGGTICRPVGAELEAEAPGDPAFHVRGATKIYRRDCWLAIGGLIEAPGWDTVDEYKANMLGWNTYTFPELKLRHNRISGGAAGTWRNWTKNGLANYVAGYHPLFMLVKCLRRALHKPFLVVGLGLLTGFIAGYARRVPMVADRELIRYVRRQQLRKLSFRDSLWNRKPA